MRTPVPTATPLKYQRVKKRLEHMLRKMSEGDRIPPERRLARDMDCSVLTVRNALGLLVDEGRITRCRGRGTFVGAGAPDLPRTRSAGGDTRDHLGVLIHSSSDAYAIRLNEVLTRKADAEGVTLHARMIQSLDRDTLPHLQTLHRQGCGAVIVPWLPAGDESAIRECVEASPLPLSLSVQVPGLEHLVFEAPGIYGTNARRHICGLYEYFLRLGFERIAFLGPDRPQAPLLQRVLSEFAAQAARAGTEMICGLVPVAGPAIDILAERWSKGDSPVAVVSFDDEHALRFMTAMHRRGMRAAETYAIVGFNNSSFAAHTDPGLSSIYQDSEHPAHWLIRNARALAAGASDQATRPAELHFALRQTCGGRQRLGADVEPLLAELGILVADDSDAPVAAS